MDEGVGLTLSGFEPNATVTLTASARDGNDRSWRSEATFEANDDGQVTLADTAPVAGTYDAADPMGPFWSMQLYDPGPEWLYLPDSPLSVTLTASIDGERRAETEVVRRAAAEGVAERSVDTDISTPGGGHSRLVGRLYEPPGEGPRPGVLLLHGSGGSIRSGFGRLLASRGYTTFAIKYVGGPDQPDVVSRVPLEYFAAGIDWLTGRDSVADGGIGVLGFSRGGELALLLGTRHEAVTNVVSYVGSGLVVSNTDGDPSWTVEGEPIPYVEVDFRNVHFRPVLEAMENASDDEVAEATIPVENVGGPTLLVSGERDQVWSSTALSKLAADRLERHDYAHRYDHRAYESAGHAIRIPNVPTAIGGGTTAGYARAAADAWPRTLRYLPSERGAI